MKSREEELAGAGETALLKAEERARQQRRAVALAAQGLTLAEIATALGRSAHFVRNAVGPAAARRPGGKRLPLGCP